MKYYLMQNASNYLNIEFGVDPWQDEYLLARTEYIYPDLEQWQPPNLRFNEPKRKNKIPIYPDIADWNPFIISQAFLDAFIDEWQRYGQLYPVNITNATQQYYIFDCTNYVDCLDHVNCKRSETRRFLPPDYEQEEVKYHYRSAVFDQSKVDGSNILKVPEMRSSLFVSEDFRTKLEILRHELKGIELYEYGEDFASPFAKKWQTS